MVARRMTNQTQAIVRIGHRLRSDTGSDEAAQIKRLALFFDRILFVLPDYWIINDEVVDDPNRMIRKPGGGYHFPNLDPFRDTTARVTIPIGRLGRELDDTLSYLVERGIAEEARPSSIARSAELREFEAVRSEFGWRDMNDETFIALSGSPETEFRAETATTLGIHSGKERLLHSVIPPKAVRDSADITSILFAAEHTSSSPVFMDSAHRAELAYRYEQYRAGLAILGASGKTHTTHDKFLDQFGSVTFHLGNAVIDSTQIARFSIESIVQLREAMDDSRRLFVSEHLVEATRLVEGNPWSRAVRIELERLAKGRLAADLVKFQQAAEMRVNQLLARRTGHLIDASAAATIGATAGLTASVVPGATPWLLALVGAVGAAAKPLSAIRRDAIDSKLEEAQAGQSSIAYLAAITREP
jgi:hypothetical protein